MRSKSLLTVGLLLLALIGAAAVLGNGSGFGVPDVGHVPLIGNATSTTMPRATSTRTASPVRAGEPLNATRLEQLIHDGINRQRAEQGLYPLQDDARLADIARRHSGVMAVDHEIFHTEPNGLTLADRFTAAGYSCKVRISSTEFATGGENVAKNWYRANVIVGTDSMARYDTPRELADGVVAQWMSSPHHRENILRSYWLHEGIGVAITQEQDHWAVYVTEDFC